MSTPTLDSNGVQQKLTELYALSDQQLSFEAQKMRNDFIQWVSDNFVLTQLQIQYLVQFMDPGFRKNLSNQLSAGIDDRLPISYDSMGDPDEVSTKRFELKNNIRIVNVPGEGPIQQGSIEIVGIYGNSQ